jgi:uncharacterized protein
MRTNHGLRRAIPEPGDHARLATRDDFSAAENNLVYHCSMSESRWATRWTRDQIRAMLLEQFEAFWQRDTGIEREQLTEVKRAAPSPHAVTISGLRRVGKSTLLAQLAHHLGEAAFYYVSFEDERFLGFEAEDSNDLFGLLVELFGERRMFVLDEIQNVQGWERFVRRFMDLGLKFYITGSNASLLSRELGNRLTGRYVPIELFPFSFVEFLRFRQYPIPDLDRLTTAEGARLRSHLAEYLRLGGIPEPLKYPELPLARTLYDDVLYRDIAGRYRIEGVRALKELAYYLMSNPANLVSFNKLKDQLRLGSVNTVKTYVDYLENSWLLFAINVYDYSVKRQQVAPKKVYAIDTGLVNAVGFSFSPDTGRLLENLVFLALRRRSNAVYYLRSPTGFEVDFYVPDNQLLIQVVQTMDDAAVRAREVRALTDALRSLGISRGLILTDVNADSIAADGLTIEIRSVAEWLIRP